MRLLTKEEKKNNNLGKRVWFFSFLVQGWVEAGLKQWALESLAQSLGNQFHAPSAVEGQVF